ncbi:MAG TPA: ParB/RepB/Spo0J family partition protein [Halanaerobiales bacterium]|nr:ParB/RepB/Spo0J family partition protein [Halanaerobiales bacterium]
MEFENIPLNDIEIDEGQPREEFDEERLKQLANSIKEVGQLQPIIVKKNGEKFSLISGERRYRAIKENGKKDKIAALIFSEDIKEDTLRQIQLVENLQRQDLNAIERAKSIQRFIDDNNLTKKAASKKLGVPRTTLTEWLTILEVQERYQKEVIKEDSPLSLSHISLARGLANKTGDPSKTKSLLNNVLKFNLSRSETKEIIKLFHNYLHMSMDEAVAAILLKRERKKISEKLNENNGKSSSKPVKTLINSLNKTGQNIEKVMSEVGNLGQEQQEDVLDQFLYIYQLMEIMIPKMKDENISELIEKIKIENFNN